MATQAPYQKCSLVGILTIVFYLFLPLEGILRKWVFGDLQQVFGFIRDPILIAIYGIYFLQRRRKLPAWTNIFILFAVPFIAYIFINGIFNDTPILVMALGVRSYVMYIPLAFILAEMLTISDIRKFIIVSLYISIPIAFLVFLQFSSPVESAINKGTSDDLEGRFVVAADIIRPYGPFTFSQAQNHFAALMVAITLIALEKRHQFQISSRLLLSAGFSSLTMGALSGGRTFFGLAMLVCAAYLVAGFTAQRARHGLSRMLKFGSMVTAFLLIFIFLFPTSFAAMSERQVEAEYAEGSTVLRALRAFDISEELNSAPVFGYGAGTGSNAALVVTQQGDFVLGEIEWGRMINELGPIIGILIIFLRVLTTALLGLHCLRVNRLTGDGSALILFGFSGYMLLYAQTTGQNQNLSFCWLTVGLTLSLCRLARAP
jgi:hypothetical protein